MFGRGRGDGWWRTAGETRSAPEPFAPSSLIDAGRTLGSQPNDATTKSLMDDAGWTKLTGLIEPDRLISRMTPTEATEILRHYGLDSFVTAADEATLWATALDQYFARAPQYIEQQTNKFGAYHFLVGADESEGEFALRQSEPVIGLRGWRVLERFDLKVIEDSFAAHRADPDMAPNCPSLSICVERPSASVAHAQIYFGNYFGPLVGSGHTFRWQRNPDASWARLNRFVSSWVS